jgi:Leucine-rich repeat (LRR) protein
MTNLKELYMRNNNITNIDEIDYLKKCQNLKFLWLEDNPICNNLNEYRKNIIEKLPNLETLDNIQINDIKNQLNKKQMILILMIIKKKLINKKKLKMI